MKYAVCWVSIGSTARTAKSPAAKVFANLLKRETVYEIYDSKELHLQDSPYISYMTQPIVFVSCTPEAQKLWKARLILWTTK